MTQVIVTLEDGRQVLVDVWDTGTVEVSQRPEAGGCWEPIGDGPFPGHVEVVR